MRQLINQVDNVAAFIDHCGQMTIEFMTPADVADLLINKSGIPADCKRYVLEPSAGTGAIVRRLLAHGVEPRRILAVEESRDFATNLESLYLPPENVICGDFCPSLKGISKSAAQVLLDTYGGVDYVIMNPPFYGTGALGHIFNAISVLNNGGTLVSIIPKEIDSPVFLDCLERDFEEYELFPIRDDAYAFSEFKVDVQGVVAREKINGIGDFTWRL